MKSQFIARSRVAALLLAVLSAAAISTAQAESWNSWMTGSKEKKEYESQISMARLSERHEQSHNAKKIYQAELVNEPQHQLAHHRMAVMAAKNGDFAKANHHFASAMQAGPASAELMGDQGYSLYLEARLEEAENVLRQTIQQFPSHKAARNTLGLVLGQMGRYDEALAEFRQVVGEAEAHANLGFIMSQSGQLEQASKHYHQALKLDENLRSAAEALVQLNDHLPAQSAVFTLNSNASSKAAGSQSSQAIAAPSPQSAQHVSAVRNGATKPAGFDNMANLDASQMNSGDPSNPIPPVAKPVVPGTPQIPLHVQTPFKFGTGAFEAPAATQPSANPTASQSQTELAQNLIETVDAIPAAQHSNVSSASLSGVKPSYGIASEEVTPAQRGQVRVFDTPIPQVMASDEEAGQDQPEMFANSQAVQLADAKAHADLLMQSSPLDQPQGYSTQSDAPVPASANQIATNMNQSGGEFLPTAFMATVEEKAISQPVEQRAEVNSIQASEVRSTNATQETAVPAVWQIVLLTVGGMIGLVSFGGAIWHLYTRKPMQRTANKETEVDDSSASIWPSNSGNAVEEEAFDMEETYTYLENQIRDVWAGRSQQSRTPFGGASTASY